MAENNAPGGFLIYVDRKLVKVKRLDTFKMMKVDSDKEELMKRVEKLRRSQPYEHINCHLLCKAKG